MTIEQPAASTEQPRDVGWMLFNLICLSLLMHLWGLKRDLPVTPEVDEPIFVQRSVEMVSFGSLDPGWYSTPASTLMVPLAAVIHVWQVVEDDAPLFQADPELKSQYNHQGADFFLLGRYLTVFYAVLCVPLIYLLGRKAFSPRTGLLGAFMFIFYPVVLDYAKTVRADSVATFFGLIGLWLCLRAFDKPSVRSHILAGIAIGLSVSSRYFMVVLLVFLVLLDLILLSKRPGALQSRQIILAACAGLATAALVFVLINPYLFLNFDQALMDIRHEARTVHLGGDGLSPLGNLVWYVSQGIPDAVSRPHYAVILLGMGFALLKRQIKPLALLGFTALFLVGISLPGLHWQRWAIQIMPVLALFAADAIVQIGDRLRLLLKLQPWMGNALIILGALAASALPAYRSIWQNIRDSHPSTRLEARQWILEHLPPGSKIALEAYSAALEHTDYSYTQFFALAKDRDLSDYEAEGYQYLVAASEIYNRYYAEAERYPGEIDFYETLSREGELLKRIAPSRRQGGPVILIYRLNPAP